MNQNDIIRLTYHSNAIEGNSMSEEDVKNLLLHDIEPGNVSFKDIVETKTHALSMSENFSSIASDTVVLETDLKIFHRTFFTPFDRREAGFYRTEPVMLRNKDTWVQFPDFRKVPSLVAEVFRELGDLQKCACPVERAAKLHFRLVSIHPFIDGNGRAVRLLSSAALCQGGYAPLYIPVERRMEYMESIATGEARFVEFIAKLVVEQNVD